jgi:FAD:protein FMN transferase
MFNKFLFGFIILGFLIPGCRKQTAVYSNFAGIAQGSTYSIVYENRNKLDPEQLRQNVEKILERFDMSLSNYKDSSLISRINRNEDIVSDSLFTEVFRRSAEISRLTDGAFDITVGPLVRAWGFGPDAHKSFSESKRDSLLKLVGMDKVSLVKGKLVKTDPHVILDFNAIAQGFSVDVVCRFFDKIGIRNYLVEIGGEVRSKGRKAGKLWRIGIDKPVDNNMVPGQDLEAIVKISDEALSTSGNYRKFYIEDGVKYSHEINPKTGYPAKNTLLSATVVAGDCATADALATAFMVMGKDKTIEFLGIHPEYEAFLVYFDPAGDFKTWASEKLKKDISESASSQ